MPRPDRHRAELLASTARLLRRRGYSGTSISDFLQAAQATNGSLYHHFPGGKEELAVAAIADAGSRVEAALREALAGEVDIVAATEAWVDALIAALRADPRDGCPVAPTALDAAGTSEPLRQAAAEAFRRWGEVFTEALSRSRPARAASAQALAVLSAIEGALLLDRTGHETAHLEALKLSLPALLA